MEQDDLFKAAFVFIGGLAMINLGMAIASRHMWGYDRALIPIAIVSFAALYLTAFSEKLL
jgi:hypothetical protein